MTGKMLILAMLVSAIGLDFTLGYILGLLGFRPLTLARRGKAVRPSRAREFLERLAGDTTGLFAKVPAVPGRVRTADRSSRTGSGGLGGLRAPR